MKIYVITLRWIDSPLNPEMIDSVLAVQGDWVRWNGWTWLLASNSAPLDIREGLRKRLLQGDSFIIAEVSPTGMDGWAPKWVWDWVAERAKPNYVSSTLPPTIGGSGDLFK